MVKKHIFESTTFHINPYPFYRQLQETGEPFWLPHEIQPLETPGMWLFARYDDVVNILKSTVPLSKRILSVRKPENIIAMDYSMLQQDPPEHTRLRSLVKQAFTPARIRSLETQINEITNELLDRMSGIESGDFMKDFALPLPLKVIAILLGIPVGDQKLFDKWINIILTGFDSPTADDEKIQQLMQASADITVYFEELIPERRKNPGDDALSAMLHAHDGTDYLSDNELKGMCMLFLVAGFETTVNLLGNGLYTLLKFPDQFTLLKRHKEHLNTAIEEMLRFESPIQRSTFRIATRNFQLGGRQFSKGEQICGLIGAANRDPVHFQDADKFDITRSPNPHIAFGAGIHTCLGAMLARLEAKVAFGELLAKLPDINLATEHPVWNETTYFRGLTSLPVQY